MHVQQTTEYKLFKEVSSNRDIDKGHIKKLAAAIREKNLLALNPIIVNPKMEILDGQHRLAAAKMLKTPIFYVVGDDISHDDISRLNTNKKNWQLVDYINYYTVKGVKEFKELSRLINEYPHFPMTFLIAVLSADGTRQTPIVKKGILDIGNKDNARTIIGYISDFEQYFDHVTNSRFLEAMLFICNSGQYDHERMISKLQRNPGALVPCANKKQYIRLLQDIYNKGTQDRNIVLFIKR